MSIENGSRHDIRQVLERDLERHARCETDRGSFWRSLGVLGMVGWPIALASTGGAILGRYLDLRWNTGIHFTLMLLTAGVLLGSLMAWSVVKDQK